MSDQTSPFQPLAAMAPAGPEPPQPRPFQSWYKPEPVTMDDLPMYLEAAYGTPWEPYIRGDVAYGMPTPHSKGQRFASDPPQITPSDETRLRYANAFQRGLHNPIVGLGSMDDPSRIGLDSGPPTDFLQMGGPMWGAYDPWSDAGVAKKAPGLDIDAHEWMHRGMTKLGPISPGQQHQLMRTQDGWDRTGTSFPPMEPKSPFGSIKLDDTLQLKNMRFRAQQEVAKARPGGPR